MNYLEIHNKAVSVARSFLSAERELIPVLQEVDAHRVYLKMNYSSLYAYCVQGLDLDPSMALPLINLARKCVKVPELQMAIDNGSLSVHKARRILPMVDRGEPALWIEKALAMPQKELEREVAKSNPDKLIPEKLKPVSETKVKLECGVSYAAEKKIERARLVLAQKLQRPVSLAETLEAMADAFLDQKDPVRKAEKNISRKSNSTSGRVPKDPRFIPAKIRHEVNLRDKGQCRHKTPQGTRCENKTFTEIHHIKPVSWGGKNIPENLITLCGGHHRVQHQTDDKSQHRQSVRQTFQMLGASNRPRTSPFPVVPAVTQ